jgi:hypothetical protein
MSKVLGIGGFPELNLLVMLKEICTPHTKNGWFRAIAADLLLMIPCWAHGGSELIPNHVGAFVGRMQRNI